MIVLRSHFLTEFMFHYYCVHICLYQTKKLAMRGVYHSSLHRFRILSVDNDQVNWVDVVHPSWPVVMVARVQRYTMGHGAFRYMLR